MSITEKKFYHMVLKDIFSYLEGSCKENILEEKMIGLGECSLNRLFVTERALKLLSPVKMVFHRIYNKIEYLQKAENMDKISDLPYNFNIENPGKYSGCCKFRKDS